MISYSSLFPSFLPSFLPSLPLFCLFTHFSAYLPIFTFFLLHFSPPFLSFSNSFYDIHPCLYLNSLLGFVSALQLNSIVYFWKYWGATVIENNIYFSNLLIIIEDHPVVLSHTLLPVFLPPIPSLPLSLLPLPSLSSHTPQVHNSFSNSPYSPLFVFSSLLLFLLVPPNITFLKFSQHYHLLSSLISLSILRFLKARTRLEYPYSLLKYYTTPHQLTTSTLGMISLLYSTKHFFVFFHAISSKFISFLFIDLNNILLLDVN